MKPELLRLMREYQAAHEWKKKCLAARDAQRTGLSECSNALDAARETKGKAFMALVAYLDAGGTVDDEED